MIAVLALLACTSQPAGITTESTFCDACGGDCTDQVQSIAPSGHVVGEVVYADPPPTSGDHNACWATWGVHDTDPGDEYWVHNEEHGGVVFLYQPDDCTDGDSAGANDCAAEVGALSAVLGTAGDNRWVVTPYADLPVAWAAVSWGNRRMLGCFDLGTLTEFFEAHVGHGSEDLSSEPASSCM